jgi:hypothetical protein
MRVQNRLDLAAFPSTCPPRLCNSSPPAATNRLATHRSTPRAPATCRGTHQSDTAGVKSDAEGHCAAVAATTTRRRRSAGPTLRASTGPGGGPTTVSGRRQSWTGGKRVQTNAAPPRISRIGASGVAPPAMLWARRAPLRLRAHPPRTYPARRWRSTRPLLRRVQRGRGSGPRTTSPRRLSPASSSWSRRAAAERAARCKREAELQELLIDDISSDDEL